MVRFSYVHVFEPRPAENPDEKGKYGVCILIPKSDAATLSRIKNAIEAAKTAGKAQWGGKIPPNLKIPLRDGDAERPEDDAFAGHYFMNANSVMKPGVVDANVNEIIDSSE